MSTTDYRVLPMGKKPTYSELLHALMGMVNQHCQHGDDHILDDIGLSANKFAFDILIRAGAMKEVRRGTYKLIWDAE